MGATERSETARAAWQDLTPHRRAERLLFLDECGAHLALTPLYARAPRGKRALGAVPCHRGKNTTLIAGLSLEGMQAPVMLEGAVNTLAFEASVEQVLAPTLTPGQSVVLENLRAHTGERVRQAIQERECQVLRLPTSSPDLTPIEEAFSKLKAFLRRVGARTHEALHEAIGRGLEAITAQDACGWFTHGGYPPDGQTANSMGKAAATEGSTLPNTAVAPDNWWNRILRGAGPVNYCEWLMRKAERPRLSLDERQTSDV